jgi:hypothetical protein
MRSRFCLPLNGLIPSNSARQWRFAETCWQSCGMTISQGAAGFSFIVVMEMSGNEKPNWWGLLAIPTGIRFAQAW